MSTTESTTMPLDRPNISREGRRHSFDSLQMNADQVFEKVKKRFLFEIIGEPGHENLISQLQEEKNKTYKEKTFSEDATSYLSGKLNFIDAFIRDQEQKVKHKLSALLSIVAGFGSFFVVGPTSYNVLAAVGLTSFSLPVSTILTIGVLGVSAYLWYKHNKAAKILNKKTSGYGKRLDNEEDGQQRVMVNDWSTTSTTDWRPH